MLDALRAHLEKHDTPAHLYTLGGLGGGECVGIAADNGGWQVYFSERGSKGSLQIHAQYSAALSDFFARLNLHLQAYGHPSVPTMK